MSAVDEVIRERLRKLRCDEQAASGSLTSEKSDSLPKPSKKTNVEQVDDLLKQLTDESVLDEAYGKDKTEIDAQIRRRLERLKVWELGPPKASFKEIGRLKSVPDVVNELLSRPGLHRHDVEDEMVEDDDRDSGKMSADDGSSSDDSDSPPNYCVFCKSEPSIVCIDCYKDSYCSKCFNEFHEPEDDHKTFTYVQKKKK
uniref:Uncharacterized protein n=1 Tax=Rhodnius prolixus TaxID=13249 RepID=A0A4P6D8B0_RHOPR